MVSPHISALNTSEVSFCSSKGAGLAGGVSHSALEIQVSSVLCLSQRLRILHFQIIDGKKSGALPIGGFSIYHFSHSVGQNSVSRLCLNCEGRLGNVVEQSVQEKKAIKKERKGLPWWRSG